VEVNEKLKKAKQNEKWGYIADTDNKSEFMEQAHIFATKDFVIYHDKLEAYAAKV